MSRLKTKSDENLKAAQELANKKLFNASVHCAYYGCFQYMKCILCNKLKVSYENQLIDHGKSSHNYIFEYIYNGIDNRFIKREFRSKFSSLKNKRVKADYHEDLFEDEMCLIAIEEANNAIKFLVTAYGKLDL